MSTRIFPAALFLSAFVTALASAAPNPLAGEETIGDRAGFIPYRKHRPLPGTVIGLLVGNPQPILSSEGRSGPLDSLCFSTDGASYRWVYVAADKDPQITNLDVPVGKGDERKRYPSLNMATLKNVKRWGVSQPYTLVEVQVNDGLGSPAEDSFVATDIKVLEGSAEYPLK